MDPFKQYLQQHADELDTDAPRPMVWQRIEQDINATKKAPVRLYLRWAVAASIAVLLGCMVWLVIPRHTNTVAVTTQPAVSHTPETPAMAEQPQAATEEHSTIAAHKNTNGESIRKTGTAAAKPEQVPTHPDETLVLHHLEAGFISVINMQLDKVRSMPMYAEGPQYYSSFKHQFQQLEEDEKALKRSIAKTGITDEQLSALIDIYQQKINVLKQLQNEIIKTNNAWKQHQDDQSSPSFMNI
ncbi:hypothetical protein [Deminuibacter soli]|uniref:Anti-sigma factor n=1 Tax=Deminuibacter soli TaxID=2291815 RepID=A0A3E1NGK6_9BACT|nr:hypothetical protein [Deminuibacter soli]RFM27079.1 hypothetical protein DXN05_16565 [Deminuibacter soli]